MRLKRLVGSQGEIVGGDDQANRGSAPNDGCGLLGSGVKGRVDRRLGHPGSHAAGRDFRSPVTRG
jgi:hypothetical protein